MIKNLIKKSVETLIPSVFWKRQLSRIRKNFSETEMYLLPLLCDKDKVAIDIGAAGGSFMVNMVDLSKKVIAFEPIPKNVIILNTISEYLKSDVEIMAVALSDSNGESILRMVDNDLGRSTIEEENVLEDGIESKKSSIKVVTKKLDSYNYSDVGFVKLDVEGHELAVLQGAGEMIQKNRPAFLIEIEERHKKNAIQNVADYLGKFGYEGLFILNNELRPLGDFDLIQHQDTNNIGDVTNHYKRKGIYINNFIFLPKEKIELFKTQAQSTLKAI